MTRYQYWRGNIFLGEDNSIGLVRSTTGVCPYCGAGTEDVYERKGIVFVKTSDGRDLFVYEEGRGFVRHTSIVTNVIGCPECVEEYERYQKGWGYGFGLDYEPERSIWSWDDYEDEGADECEY